MIAAIGLSAIVLGFNAALVNANKHNSKVIVVEFTNPLNSVISVDTFYVNAENVLSLGERVPIWVVVNTCPDNTVYVGEADIEVEALMDLLEHDVCSTPDKLQHDIVMKYGEIVATWIEE